MSKPEYGQSPVSYQATYEQCAEWDDILPGDTTSRLTRAQRLCLALGEVVLAHAELKHSTTGDPHQRRQERIERAGEALNRIEPEWREYLARLRRTDDELA